MDTADRTPISAATPSPLRLQVQRAVRALDDLPRGDEFGDGDLNPSLSPRSPRRSAAVLVPIVERRDGHTVLLTRRSDHLHDHPGQVCFPGGRLDDTDRGPIDAALRETAEEIGLSREYVDLAGLLDDLEKEELFIVEKGPDSATRVHAAQDVSGLRRDIRLYPKYRSGVLGGLPKIG